MRTLLILLLLASSFNAVAQTRAALVIGNCLYAPSQPPDAAENLPNACKDAASMAAALRAKGFNVIHRENLDTEGMEDALVAFKKHLNRGAVGVFYYSGHALQHEKQNYLLPVETRINCALLNSQLPVLARVTAQGVLKEMQAEQAAMKILILDACRISPLQSCTKAPRGLAAMERSRGTIISYATGPDDVAYDESGYTPALVKALEKYPHLPADQMLRKAPEFMSERFKQTPWVEAVLSAGRDFCFGTCGGGIVPPAQVQLTVHSNVPKGGDTVFIDGEPHGATQVIAQLVPGLHYVRITADGYQDWEREIELRDQPYTVWARLAEEEIIPPPPPPPPSGTWHDSVTGLEFARIKGDCFQMGSPASEAGRSDNENQHEVCVNDFWLATTEVTNAQYRLFKASHDSTSYEGHSLNGDNQPAVYISWQDAVAFTEWLNRRHNGRYQFRLPTEAEWEYAARAGTRTARYWGESENAACRYANVHDRTSKQAFSDFTWEAHGCSDGYAVTAPVGRFQSNGFDLYDMLGNVWEWTCSEWAAPYNGEEKQCSGKNHAKGARVIRGGSWLYEPRNVRSAVRGFGAPGNRIDNLGFRPARIE